MSTTSAVDAKLAGHVRDAFKAAIGEIKARGTKAAAIKAAYRIIMGEDPGCSQVDARDEFFGAIGLEFNRQDPVHVSLNSQCSREWHTYQVTEERAAFEQLQAAIKSLTARAEKLGYAVTVKARKARASK